MKNHSIGGMQKFQGVDSWKKVENPWERETERHKHRSKVKKEVNRHKGLFINYVTQLREGGGEH